MGRLRLHEREAVRALWRGVGTSGRGGLSGLTPREYCERHGLSLKSFGNWRGQLQIARRWRAAMPVGAGIRG